MCPYCARDQAHASTASPAIVFDLESFHRLHRLKEWLAPSSRALWPAWKVETSSTQVRWRAGQTLWPKAVQSRHGLSSLSRRQPTSCLFLPSLRPPMKGSQMNRRRSHVRPRPQPSKVQCILQVHETNDGNGRERACLGSP